LFDVTRWFMPLDLPQISLGAGYRSPNELPVRVPDIVDLTFKFDRFITTFSGQHGEMADAFWGETGYLSVNRSYLRYGMFPAPGNPPPVKMKSTEISPEKWLHMQISWIACEIAASQPPMPRPAASRLFRACWPPSPCYPAKAILLIGRVGPSRLYSCNYGA
jgi:hypothetical protein